MTISPWEVLEPQPIVDFSSPSERISEYANALGPRVQAFVVDGRSRAVGPVQGISEQSPRSAPLSWIRRREERRPGFLLSRGVVFCLLTLVAASVLSVEWSWLPAAVAPLVLMVLGITFLMHGVLHGQQIIDARMATLMVLTGAMGAVVAVVAVLA